jgi:hypothetical protein
MQNICKIIITINHKHLTSTHGYRKENSPELSRDHTLKSTHIGCLSGRLSGVSQRKCDDCSISSTRLWQKWSAIILISRSLFAKRENSFIQCTFLGRRVTFCSRCYSRPGSGVLPSCRITIRALPASCLVCALSSRIHFCAETKRVLFLVGGLKETVRMIYFFTIFTVEPLVYLRYDFTSLLRYIFLIKQIHQAHTNSIGLWVIFFFLIQRNTPI